MSESIYLLTIGLPLATILLVFGMRYLSAYQQAKVRLANDASYHQLAEKLAVTQAALAQVTARVAAIEKLLKEVE